MRYCRPGDGWEAVKHLPGTLHYNCFSLSLSLLKEVVELVLPSLCSVHSPLLAGFQPFSRLTWVGRDFDPQNCHDAMMQSELGKLPTVNQPPPAHTICNGKINNFPLTSDWKILQTHFLLFMVTFGFITAETHNWWSTGSKEWLSEKVLSARWFTAFYIPAGLSCNKIILINSGRRGRCRLIAVQQIETLLRIL